MPVNQRRGSTDKGFQVAWAPARWATFPPGVPRCHGAPAHPGAQRAQPLEGPGKNWAAQAGGGMPRGSGPGAPPPPVRDGSLGRGGRAHLEGERLGSGQVLPLKVSSEGLGFLENVKWGWSLRAIAGDMSRIVWSLPRDSASLAPTGSWGLQPGVRSRCSESKPSPITSDTLGKQSSRVSECSLDLLLATLRGQPGDVHQVQSKWLQEDL